MSIALRYSIKRRTLFNSTLPPAPHPTCCLPRRLLLPGLCTPSHRSMEKENGGRQWQLKARHGGHVWWWRVSDGGAVMGLCAHARGLMFSYPRARFCIYNAAHSSSVCMPLPLTLYKRESYGTLRIKQTGVAKMVIGVHSAPHPLGRHEKS